jgi:hypothetical protein
MDRGSGGMERWVSSQAGSKSIQTALKEIGGLEDGNVEVDISYDIIRHVSAQLYTNPRKAIEELICNSYDAGAVVCYVTLPKDNTDVLMVLDNGKSMDLDGLKKLWKVADSPKFQGENKPRIENNRMQIGKFGVGKLAAFALGKRLTHVACVDKTVRIISVGQMDIKQKKAGEAPSFTVIKISLEKAIPFLEKRFGLLPRPWQKGWETWTLAIVDDIDPGASGRALLPHILKRMITTALPISSDFQVFLDGEAIPKKEIDPDDIEVSVDVTDLDFRKKLQSTLQSFWQGVLGKNVPEDVPESYYDLKIKKVPNPEKVCLAVDALIVPELGPVMGNSIMTKTSLTTDKLIERGYVNNGFAIRVNGKLINPEDELFGVTQRSLGYWTRFIANVEIPGLDNVLLVQRNAVSENSNQAQVARAVLRALFNFTRVKDDEIRRKEANYVPESFGTRLHTLSPIIAPIALDGLTEGKLPKDGLESLEIDFSSLGDASPAVHYDTEEKKILVNQDHPLIEALDDLGPNSKILRRVVGEVLAGTQMAKGYLRSQNVSEKVIQETGEIIEVSVRSAAGFVIDEVEENIKEITDASFIGDKVFEDAVVSAFRSLRIAAARYGEPDEPDGIIEIVKPGAPNLRISVEAKGSKGKITHKQLSEATVTRHSQEFNCSYAIAIAREFAVDGIDNQNSALLRETENKVPLITTKGIALLLRLHKKRPFTSDKIEKILTTWTHPDKLEQFIEDTWKELPELGLLKLVLDVAYEQTQKNDINLPSPGMILGDERIIKCRLPLEDLVHVLETVQIATAMIFITNKADYRFKMFSDPNTILEALQKKFSESNPLATNNPSDLTNPKYTRSQP